MITAVLLVHPPSPPSTHAHMHACTRALHISTLSVQSALQGIAPRTPHTIDLFSLQVTPTLRPTVQACSALATFSWSVAGELRHVGHAPCTHPYPDRHLNRRQLQQALAPGPGYDGSQDQGTGLNPESDAGGPSSAEPPFPNPGSVVQETPDLLHGRCTNHSELLQGEDASRLGLFVNTLCSSNAIHGIRFYEEAGTPVKVDRRWPLF